MQISGISEQVAYAIAELYPTINSLYQVYKHPNLTQKDKQELLKNIAVPGRSSKVGNATSMKVYQMFHETNPDAPVL